MDPLSKYKGRINGEKRLVENFKYEITCYKKDGKFIWTKQKISPPFKCAVCEQKCTFHYYGVLSCEGRILKVNLKCLVNSVKQIVI